MNTRFWLTEVWGYRAHVEQLQWFTKTLSSSPWWVAETKFQQDTAQPLFVSPPLTLYSTAKRISWASHQFTWCQSQCAVESCLTSEILQATERRLNVVWSTRNRAKYLLTMERIRLRQRSRWWPVKRKRWSFSVMKQIRHQEFATLKTVLKPDSWHTEVEARPLKSEEFFQQEAWSPNQVFKAKAWKQSQLIRSNPVTQLKFRVIDLGTSTRRTTWTNLRCPCLGMTPCCRRCVESVRVNHQFWKTKPPLLMM